MRRIKVRNWLGRLAMAAACFVAAAPAAANDTTAELRTGGLVFVRSDVIEMQSEDLFISMDEVRVDYRFVNRSSEDVRSIVAFPMPDVAGSPYANMAVPYLEADNLLGFTVEADGRAIRPQLEQRAFAAELDVTQELLAAGLSLNPFAERNEAVLIALPGAKRADWVARGIMHYESYTDGGSTQTYAMPLWRLKSTFWWEMVFPAGRPLSVRHRYAPSVGGTVAVTFLEDGVARGEQFRAYQHRFCAEGGFVRAVEKAARESRDGQAPYAENWISYVLTTGGNWAGTIGRFRLTIDKGAPENLVSFCGTGVRKVGPTTFEMVAEDFYPMRDIEVLILRPVEWAR